MISKLFGTDSIIDLFSSPAFWIGVAIVVVIIALIVCAFKYPKIGGPMLLGVTVLGFVALTAYCAFNLNAYYTAEGGIRGKITGIFETNKAEVVDNMAFKFENIELKELSIGTYSASITLDEVLSIDTKNNLGVFVNRMPCDVTSSVHKDYAIAYYVYTFYDENETSILTDTLTLTFAFYENSTTLKISTNGTTEAIKLWHYYFNKNGFVVSIAPFDYDNSGIIDGTGDVSNYAIVKYLFDGELYQTKVSKIGNHLELIWIGDNFYNWYVNNELVTEDYIVTGNMFVEAYSGDFVNTYTVNTVVNGHTVYSDRLPGENWVYELSVPTYSPGDEWQFAGWSTDGTSNGIIDGLTYHITEDVTFTAIYSRSVWLLGKPLECTVTIAENYFGSYPVNLDQYINLPSLLNSDYEFCIDLTLKVTNENGSDIWDIKLTEEYSRVLLDNPVVLYGYIPFTLYSNNQIGLGEGVPVNFTWLAGTYLFSFNDVTIYTK